MKLKALCSFAEFFYGNLQQTIINFQSPSQMMCQENLLTQTYC